MRAHNGKLSVYSNADELAQKSAVWLFNKVLQSQGRFAICLSGGSTPRRLYELLAGDPLRNAFPWHRVHWFWGDERFVDPSSPDSNFNMTRLAMLQRAPVPAENIHAIPTVSLDPPAAALAYQRELMAYYGEERLVAGRPLFDVTLLGLGEDGHTASLFPGSPTLMEKSAWVSYDQVSRPEPRITLTYPALEASLDTVFLVAGSGKRAILDSIRRGGDCPAARLAPSGDVYWFVDREAHTDRAD
jgi:6-phosphogluconolactonase